MLPRRRLGAHGPEVSALALGSWRTFERIERDQALGVMRDARDLGVTFLDEARYDDETGRAPIPTGYSEVLFGELFRGAGYSRGGVVMAEKLWWQFWPQQSAAEELAASLERLRFDDVDLIYAVTLPERLSVAEATAEVAGILASGAARSWGVANWTAQDLVAATAAAAQLGIAAPCAVQLPYSVVQRAWAEDTEMLEALRASDASVVASAVLEGGLLSGKYAAAGATGRMAAEVADPARAAALRAGAELVELAREWETSAAALAVAFTLDHPRLASVLVGATSAAQLDATAAAFEVHARLDDGQRARLRAVGVAR